MNVRHQAHVDTGVQRYTNEILSRIPHDFDELTPRYISAVGIMGHLWEQTALPARASNKLLWSPACTGPFWFRNQVVTVHDLSPLENASWYDWKYGLWHRALVPYLLRRVRKIIAVSKFTKRRISQIAGVPGNKISVVYNGVSRGFQPASKEAIKQSCNEFGLNENRYVLALFSLHPRKNISRLVHAWQIMTDAIDSDLVLVLAGAKGQESVFGKYEVESLPGNVLPIGYVDDKHLPALYSGAVAFVYPSLYEGFGLPILEAMACGTPVITSEITALPEVAGDAACLVNPYDTHAIARGLKEVLTDANLQKRLRSRGLQRVEDFSWDQTAHETWQVIMEQMSE